MSKQVEDLISNCATNRQVLIYSTVLSNDARSKARALTSNASEFYPSCPSKLMPPKLMHYRSRIAAAEAQKQLEQMLDALEFNQVIIFTKTTQRAVHLAEHLLKICFPAVVVSSHMQVEDRIRVWQDFQAFRSRILVTTNAMGMDTERVNIVINYDAPTTTDAYLVQAGKAACGAMYGCGGLVITLSTSCEVEELLGHVEAEHEIKIPDFPGEIPASAYMNP
eukprot:TRINITY_DN50804_c0_g1_i1.p1 TRINITY_DN50804_c0_g1~~TRINITY_DN50804_c0_g1_i1.p1  ORF type:complete len:222 (+),score=27.93 TRINITY_DN50804_c0_g1_i1:688-1353(+)